MVSEDLNYFWKNGKDAILESSHVALEIGQSIASDFFTFAKIAETIFKKAELGCLPQFIVRALNADPSQRPGLDEIIRSLSLRFATNAYM